FWVYLIRRDVNGDGTIDTSRGVNDDISVVVQQVNALTGALVGPAVDVTPGSFFDDKPWIAADANPASPFANNLYVSWDRISISPNPFDVLFARSVDQGASGAGPGDVNPRAGYSGPTRVAVPP